MLRAFARPRSKAEPLCLCIENCAWVISRCQAWQRCCSSSASSESGGRAREGRRRPAAAVQQCQRRPRSRCRQARQQPDRRTTWCAPLPHHHGDRGMAVCSGMCTLKEFSSLVVKVAFPQLHVAPRMQCARSSGHCLLWTAPHFASQVTFWGKCWRTFYIPSVSQQAFSVSQLNHIIQTNLQCMSSIARRVTEQNISVP